LVNSSSFLPAIALGHSLRQIHRNITFYVLRDSSINSSESSILERYFTVVDLPESLIFPEAGFWQISDCFPVVAVSPFGVFREPIDRLCAAKPFSAVSRVDEVVWFDPSLMVLDPSNVPAFSDLKESFSEFSKAGMSWTPLKPELSVMDIAQDYMEFALRYLRPTYIHFSAETFTRAAQGQSVGNGSAGLFEMIQPIITAALPEYRARRQ
jgi:hypothetical protein